MRELIIGMDGFIGRNLCRHWDHGQPVGWRNQDHIDVGTQLPWALATQVMAWADDTFENIRDAYDRFVEAQ